MSQIACPAKELQGGFIKVDIKGLLYSCQWNPQLGKQIILLPSVCFCFSFPFYTNKETTSFQSGRDKQVYKSRKQVVEYLTAGTPLFYPQLTCRPLGSHQHSRAKVPSP